METLTNKGCSAYIFQGFKYRFYRKNSKSESFWRCSNKYYKARIKTVENSDVVEEFGVHTYDENVKNIAAVATRVACKRKASEDISQRHTKMIHAAESF